MARDKIHNVVKNALVKAGWDVTHDPYFIKYKGERVFVDLAARRLLAAERGDEKIAVEIKSFIGHSLINDVENALGQYMLYQNWLGKIEPERTLYLGIDAAVYQLLLRREALQELLSDFSVHLIVVDEQTEEITEWKTH